MYLIAALTITGISIPTKAAEKREQPEQAETKERTAPITPAPTKLPEQTMVPKPTENPSVSTKPTEYPSVSANPAPSYGPKLAAPVLHTAPADEKGIHVDFSSVEGARMYYIYIRKAGSASGFFEISELAAERYETVMAQGGVFLSVEEEDVELGISYEIMVRSSKNYIISQDSNILRADMPQDIVAGVSAKASSQSSVTIEWDRLRGVNGYEIQFSLTENGPYQTAVILQDNAATSWVHHNLELGTTYYYKVRAYAQAGGVYYSDIE